MSANNISNFTRSVSDKGYHILKNVFTNKQILELNRPLQLDNYKEYISFNKGMKGYRIKKNIDNYIIFLTNKETEKKLISNTIKVFKDTEFYKNNLLDFSNNGWNAVRVNMPNKKHKNVHWHQDLQTPLENKDEIFKNHFYTFWIPFTSVSKKNSLEILPYSHEKTVFNNHYRLGIPLPKIYRELPSIKMNFDAGDILVLDNLTFHRSVFNTSNLLRISVDLRFSNNTPSLFKTHFKLKKRMFFNDLKKFIKKVVP